MRGLYNMKTLFKNVFGLIAHRTPYQITNTVLSRVERRMGRARPISYPPRLDIVLTKACNLNCVFCISNTTIKDERWLPFEMYERVAAKLFPYARSVRFCSGGEPFLYTKIREALLVAKRYRVETGIVSNGTLISEDISSWLVKDQSLDIYLLSFDGVTKKTLESIRKGANYERIIANIGRLAKMRDEAGSKVPEIRLRYAVMRSNIEELPDIFKLSEAIGFRAVEVNYLNVSNDISDQESLFFHQDLAAEVFEKARQKASEHGIRLNLPPIPREDTGERACIFPWDFVQVDTDGAIRHCYKAWVQSLGFFDDGFDKIWRGSHYASIRKTLGSDSPYFPYCAYCSNRKGLSHEAGHNHLLNQDAYVIPGLECYQANFNDRLDESRTSFRSQKSQE